MAEADGPDAREARVRLGFLASHGGSAFGAIVEAIAAGRLVARPAVLISNNSRSLALGRAREAGVPALHLSAATHPDPAALDAAIAGALDRHGADLVILSGYMKKIGPETLRRFQGRILNTHPALLPRYGGAGMYGARVHQAVLAAGDAVTGATIHVVDAEYDHGPVVAQREVPVLPGDGPESLAERVKAAEGELFVEALRAIAAGRIHLPV